MGQEATVQYPETHYCDAIMGIEAYQITSLTIVYSIVYSDADQSKHQSCAPLAFGWGIHRGPVNSPPKWPVTRKMFPFDDVIINKQPFKFPMMTLISKMWKWTIRQLIESLIRLVYLSLEVWNIRGFGATVMVPCLKTKSNLVNTLRPIRFRKPNSAHALETGNAFMGTMGTFLPIYAR